MNQVSLIADSNIPPNRLIEATGARSGDLAGAESQKIVGVSAEQSEGEGVSFAASAGNVIPLQSGRVVRVEAGAAITTATENRVKADANGRVITGTADDICCGIALTDASGAADGTDNLTVEVVLTGPFPFPGA